MASPIQPLLDSINKKGVVLPNKYVVDFAWPTLMDRVGFGLMREMDQDMFFRVTEVNLAGRNITSFPEPNIYGPIRETPEGISYAEDISITFLETADMEIRSIFEAWQGMIFDDQNGTWDLQYYDDYIGQLDIKVLSEGTLWFHPSYGIRCYEVYPKTIGPIPLSSAATTSPITTQVSFAFRYWKNIEEYDEYA